MHCPFCRNPDSRVIDSRSTDDGAAIRRRRAPSPALPPPPLRVEQAIRATGNAEMASHEVGLAILGPLRELDEVAYLRFASVYRGFESIDDFEKEIEALRAAERGR